VRTMNSAGNSRQQQLSQNRPSVASSDMRRASEGGVNNSASRPQSNVDRAPRTWEAQGSSTDRGRAPTGFGSSTNAEQSARVRSDRPAWAGSGQPGGSAAGNPNRGTATLQYNAPANNNRGYSAQPRSYEPPARTYSAPSRSYPAPSRSYTAPSRSYSAPARSYSAPAPSRSYSAPSRSSGGGGSAPHSSGGGSHASGGGPHGSGGGGSHHR
jgi:hypothetical protein